MNAVCASGMYVVGDHVSSVHVSASMEKSMSWETSTLREGNMIFLCHYDLAGGPLLIKKIRQHTMSLTPVTPTEQHTTTES